MKVLKLLLVFLVVSSILAFAGFAGIGLYDNEINIDSVQVNNDFGFWTAGFSTIIEHNGDIYTGTLNPSHIFNPNGGAQIWRMDGQTGQWSRIADKGIISKNNFTTVSAFEFLGELYFSVWNLSENNGDINMNWGMINNDGWEFDPKSAFGLLFRLNEDDPDNLFFERADPIINESGQKGFQGGAVCGYAELNGKLYIGITGDTANNRYIHKPVDECLKNDYCEVGIKIFSTKDGREWKRLNIPFTTSKPDPDAENNTDVTSLVVHKGELYAGLENNTDGTQVWKMIDEEAGYWEQVNVNGFGNPNNVNTSKMVSYNDKLYAITWNTDIKDNKGNSILHNGVELLSYDENGTSWTIERKFESKQGTLGLLDIMKNLPDSKGLLYYGTNGGFSETFNYKTGERNKINSGLGWLSISSKANKKLYFGTFGLFGSKLYEATFGLNAGNRKASINANAVNAMKYSCPYPGKISSVGILFDDPTPSGTVRMAIYNENEDGTPGTPLTDTVTANVANGWVEVEIPEKLIVEQTNYWFVFALSKKNDIKFQTGRLAGSHIWGMTYAGDSLPDNLINMTFSNNSQFVMRAVIE